MNLFTLTVNQTCLNMNNKIIAFTILLVVNFVQTQAQEDPWFTVPNRGFVSWQPAKSWEHDLLSGNGTMGALVTGQPHEETIILTESNLFLPINGPQPPINQANRLAEIRKLILAGKNEEAAKIPVQIRGQEGYKIGADPFIPAFELKIGQEGGNISRYQRAVNFETGEASVSWKDAEGSFQRRVFVSRPDSVIIVSIRGTGKIKCTLNFEQIPVEWTQSEFVKSAVKEMSANASDQWLSYRCDFKNHYPGRIQGYEGVGRLILDGGTSKVVNNKIQISGANSVMLLIKISPSANIAKSLLTDLKSKLQSIPADYGQLSARHTKVHGALFNRSRLSLNGSEADRSLYSEELIQKGESQVPLALIERDYDAGRYNILSAMGSNPPNLQGIWSGTWTAPWSADYTHDGNVQAAISSVMSSNMPELMNAYFKYLEAKMPAFRENAQRLYGTKGIHIPAHTSTTGLDMDFGDVWCLTYWTGAAGWASGIFYDYYKYTQDEHFLRERAYPFMKESLLFYEEFLQPGANGKYVFNPSYSPENNPGNNKSQAAINATMDVMIARQLLNNSIAAAQTLHVDAAKVSKWKAMLKKMPEYEISSEGTMREWLWPGATENDTHRHSSQLYSLYGQADPDIVNNKALKQAVNRTLEEKLKFRQSEGGGEMAFGLVQLGLSAAHIGEAQKAEQVVNWLATKYWSAGMGSFHNVGNLLNTDISGGMPAVILEMLVYADGQQISLLPALPKSWTSGKLDGALLKGNVEVKTLEWNNNVINAVLLPANRRQVTLKFPANAEKLMVNGIVIKASNIRGNAYNLQLEQGKEMNLAVTLKQVSK
jgi:alpha-L-fucosidase 2